MRPPMVIQIRRSQPGVAIAEDDDTARRTTDAIVPGPAQPVALIGLPHKLSIHPVPVGEAPRRIQRAIAGSVVTKNDFTTRRINLALDRIEEASQPFALVEEGHYQRNIGLDSRAGSFPDESTRLGCLHTLER